MTDELGTAPPLKSLFVADVRAFKASTARDQYSVESFMPWEQLERELATLRPAIARLQALVDTGDRRISSLSKALRDEPLLVVVFNRLLAAPGGIGFADGRQLPSEAPSTEREARRIARLLVDLGIWVLVPDSSQVDDLVLVALVAGDSRRRGYRRTATIESRVEGVINAAITRVAQITGQRIGLLKPSEFPDIARGRAAFLVGLDGRPVAAINPVFQAATGGRQQRDLLVTYPNLQTLLDSIPAHLVLIADGAGLAETPTRILASLFESVAACMTFRQAESGQLESAIQAAVSSGGLRGTTQAPLDSLVGAALQVGSEVSIVNLPASTDVARLALARYASAHNELALVLSPNGEQLRWERGDSVARALSVLSSFDPKAATSLFRALLGGSAAVILEEREDGSVAGLVELPPDKSLPQTVLVVATHSPADSDVLRATAAQSLSTSPEAKIAIAICSSRDPGFGEAQQRRLQALLPVNVIVVEPSHLLQMAQERRTPRTTLVELVLQQSDLTKASPFILSSATPERMFFGREAEEAALIATLPTNSAALLGSRKIGKTSMLRHLETQLRIAGFAPYFMDCQTVRHWEDFGALAASRWNIGVPKSFSPRHVFDLAEQLSNRQPGQLVLLLDEIDQLLDWDEHHSEDEVPEAFFRACRTLSHERSAQFVFSGERTIARKLWDPHSPHWNFCRPLSLQQLTRDAAEQLLLSPLEALEITVTGKESVARELWEITSGHPQLIQVIGDNLVRLLDQRDQSRRSTLDTSDVTLVTNTYEFRELFLETYWGQATRFERLVSVWVAIGSSQPSDLAERAQTLGLSKSVADVSDALRMLTLYGLVEPSGPGYAMRAAWFASALDAYGGPTQIEAQLREAIDD
jgi:hypothetical protein